MAGQVNHSNVQDVFTYHAPDAGQLEALQKVRSKALELARVALDHCPPCADTSAGMRKLREAVMTFNAAIALKGTI